MGRVQDLLDKKKKNDGAAAGGSSGSAGTGRVNEMFKKKGYEVVTGSDQAANAASKYAQHELKMTGKTTYAGKTYTAPVDKEYKAMVDEYNRLSSYDVTGGRNRLGRLQEEYDRLTRDGRRSMVLAGDPLSGLSSDDASRYLDTQNKRHEVGAQISALSKDVNAADRLQTSERYRALADEDGFSDYRGMSSETLDALDEKYAKVGGRLADTSNVMTDDERTTYNYLLANRGEAAAQEYLNFLEDELNYRAGTKWAEGIQDLGALGEFIHTAGVSVGSGLDQFKTGAKAQFTGEVDTPSAWQYAGGALREDLDGVAGAAYDLANVVANMAPSILVASLLHAVGLPGAALVGSATLGLSASGNAYAQKVQEGYTKEQAQTYGAMVGASEGAFSYLLGGISALGKNVVGKTIAGKVGSKMALKVASIDNAFARVSLQFGGKLAVSMNSEGVEEALQSVLEPLFAAMAFDEAYEPAAWEDIAYSYLLGALSAGLFEGGTIASEFTGYRKTGKEYIQLGDEVVNSIIETGLESETDTVSHVVAQRLQEKQQAGQSVTAFDLGQLYAENVKQVASEYAAGRFNDEGWHSAAQEAPRAQEQMFEGEDTTRTENAAAVLKMQNAEERATQAAYAAGKANLPRQMANIISEAQEEAYMAGQRDRITTASDAKLAVENQMASAYTGINETEVMNNGTERVHLREGVQRNDSADSQGPVRQLEESAGRDQSRSVQRRPADGEAAGISYGKKVSTAELGIEGGSKMDGVFLVDSNATSSTRAAQKIADERGLKLVLFAGHDLHMEGEQDGARGYYDGKTLYVRVDDPDFTAEQIARHESGHDMIAKGEIDLDMVRERIADEETAAKLYAMLYAGTNMTADEIWEECICDALGNMNMFVGTDTEAERFVDRFMNEARQTVENSRQAPRGPPTESSGKASRVVDREYQSNFSGRVFADKWVKLSNREKAAISSAIKSGNAHMSESGDMGSVNVGDKCYLFEPFSGGDAYIRDVVDADELNIHKHKYSQGEKYGKRKGNRRASGNPDKPRSGSLHGSEHLSGGQTSDAQDDRVAGSKSEGDRSGDDAESLGAEQDSLTYSPDYAHWRSAVKGKASRRLDASKLAPMFYSKMEQVLQDVKQEKLGAASVVSMLRGKGVKAEEIKWSGIEAWLEGKKSVTKQELLEFIRANDVVIEEEELASKYREFYDAVLRETGIHVTKQEFAQMAAEDAGGGTTALEFLLYGENLSSETAESLTELYKAAVSADDYDGGGANWGEYKLDGGKNYREYLFKMPGSNYTNQAMDAHWGDTKGVLAHARVQDFDTADGKMLFIEEIQSDWHNEGSKKGYSKKGYDTDAEIADLDRRKIELIRRLASPDLADLVNRLSAQILEEYKSFGLDPSEDTVRHTAMQKILSARHDAATFASYNNIEMSADEMAAVDAIRQERDAIDRERASVKVNARPPEAPYSKTYHEFVLKNLLRKAAEGDYSSFGWTTGEIQEERWSSAYAEGYRIEYDQDIPKFLNKYGKQWGAKVEKRNLKDGTVVWYMPITDAMKESVLYEGQPRYSRRVDSEELAKEIDRIIEDGRKVGRSDTDIRADVRAAVDEVYQGMIEKYGAIEPGENPSREVRVPKKTAKGKKVSQTVRTVMEAGATPDEVLPNIEQMIATGDFSYDVYSDKAAIADAHNSIEKIGWAQSLADWTDAMKRGEVSKKNTAMGWALYNNAVNSGDVDTALTVLDYMVKHQRNAAQALQATRILKKLSPETQLYQVQRSVESLQEELNERYGDKNAPELKIDPELAERYMKSKDQEERDEVMKDIYRDIGRQMPSRFIDKWNAWRYLAMLGNPRTHVRNVLGNAFFAPVVAVKNLTATGIESAVSRVSGGKLNRTKSLMSGAAWANVLKEDKPIIFGNEVDRELLKAAWDDFAKIQDAAMSGGKYNDFANANQYIEDGKQVFKFKPLEAARKGNTKAMEKEDMWFSRPHYAAALASYCKQHGLTPEQIAKGKETKNARAYAIKEAQKATYRDTNALSQTISELGKARAGETNPVKKGVGIVMEGILPFRKTPANILARGLEYSPVGLMNGVKQAVWDVKKGKKTGAEAIDSISAGLIGTGLLVLGMYLASQGLIRGHGDDDDKENEFKELMGHQAYALEVGDTSVTLDWLAPEVLPLFIGVNLWEQTNGADEELTLAAMLNAVKTVTEPLLEMSCLQSLNDVFDSVGYAASEGLDGLPAALASAATSYLTQGLPTILGQAERTGEDVRMTTYTEKNAFLTGDMQYTLGRASARIPGIWDYQQIPYIDAWGRKEYTGSADERALNNFLNPAYTSQIETSKMEEELLRLYEQTGEGSVLPSRAAKYFTVDGERKDLTAEEYVKYAQKKGQASYDLVTKLTGNKQYSSMNAEHRVRAVEEVYDYANQTAKASISKYKVESWVTKAQNAQKQYGISPDVYICLKVRASDFESLKDKDGETIDNSKGLQVMLMVYNTPGLTENQREAMFEYLGVGKSIRHYNKALVEQELAKMRKK